MVFERAPWYQNAAWLLPLLCAGVAALAAHVRCCGRSPPSCAAATGRRWPSMPRRCAPTAGARSASILILAALGTWALTLALMFKDLNNLSTEVRFARSASRNCSASSSSSAVSRLMLWNLRTVWSGTRRWPAKALEHRARAVGLHRAVGGIRVQADRLRGELLMRVLQLGVAVEKLRLAAPFRISGFVFEEQEVVVVTLDDGLHRGRGEASGVYYLNDTAHGDGGGDRSRTRQSSKRASIAPRCRTCCRPAARAMRSIARCGNSTRSADRMPVWKLAGLPARRSRWSRPSRSAPTIPPRWRRARANMPRRARSKLKLTGELDLDIARVRAVRAARPGCVDGRGRESGLRHRCARFADRSA